MTPRIIVPKLIGKLPFIGSFALGSLYEGADTSRARTTIPYWATDSKRELTRWTRLQLLSKARSLYANDGFTRGAVRDMARYSVGTGLTPKALTENEAWNAKAEAYWAEWCKVCDVTGRWHFNTIQKIVSLALDVDGDIGVLMVNGPGGFPMIQLVRSHRIGRFRNSGVKEHDGVLVNSVGRAVAYELVVGEWSEQQFETKIISASDFILIMEGERDDALRGATSLYHAINTLHDKKDILDFEKMGVKNASAIAAVLKTSKGNADVREWQDDEKTEESQLTLADMQGGTIPVIGKDEDLTISRSDRPGSAFTGFLDFLIKDVSTGLGLPSEFLWNTDRLGGASQRFVLAKAQRRFTERQAVLKNAMLDRLWFWVMAKAIKDGALPSVSEPWRVKWNTPTALTVDAGRESMQDREDLKMGLTTEAELYALRGLDWRNERRQRFVEVNELLTSAKQLANTHGIELGIALNLLQQTTPNGNVTPAEGNAPSGKKPDDKASKK